MRKLIGLDQNFQTMKSLQLLSSSFSNINIKQIKNYCDSLSNPSTHDNSKNNNKNTNQQQVSYQAALTKCLQILVQSNKNSLKSLKALFFITFVMRQRIRNGYQCGELIYQYINIIIQKQNTRLQKCKNLSGKTSKLKGLDQQCSRQSSVDKAFNWLKHKVSRSKDKDLPRNNMDSHQNQTMNLSIVSNISSRNNSNTNRCKTQAATQNNIKVGKVEGQNQMMSKQQFIITKIVIPYSAYLLKLYTSQTTIINIYKRHKVIKAEKIEVNGPKSKQSLPKTCQTDPIGINTTQLWKLLNMLSYILKIAESFPCIFRYYVTDYEYVVYSLIQVIDYEVKVTYPIFMKILERHIQNVKTQLNKVVQLKQQDQISLILRKVQPSKLQKIIASFNLLELKQMLKQISVLNQLLKNLYLCKYTYVGIIQMRLQFPILFDEKYYSIIFDIIDRAQKNRNRSVSRQRAGLIGTGNTPTSRDGRLRLLGQEMRKEKQKEASRSKDKNQQLIARLKYSAKDIDKSSQKQIVSTRSSIRDNDDNQSQKFKQKQKLKEDIQPNQGQNLCLFKRMRMKAKLEENGNQDKKGNRRLRL